MIDIQNFSYKYIKYKRKKYTFLIHFFLTALITFSLADIIDNKMRPEAQTQVQVVVECPHNNFKHHTILSYFK